MKRERKTPAGHDQKSRNRRTFLAALGAVTGASVGLSVAGERGVEMAAAASPAGAARAPSAVALAFAASCREFDPHLTDVQIATIARRIDENRAAAVTLNPKSKPLRNADEPVARFAAAERVSA